MLATQKSLNLGAPIPVAIIMGTITAVAGGMLRDIICNVIPMILRQEIYATAAILGGALLVTFQEIGLQDNIALVSAIVGALTLRLAAIYWNVSLPAFAIIEKEDKR